MEIGFIGLGNMGRPMASNLLRAGHQLTVYDVGAEAVQALVKLGARPASTAAELGAVCDVVFTMLPTEQHVAAAYFSANGLAQTVRLGTIMVDCSTISVTAARAFELRWRERQCHMLDAPVSGGVGGAAAGALTFMVGGSSDTLQQVESLFRQMGQTLYHAGGPGSGQAVKMCNNMLLAILMAGTTEALKLGIAHGLEPAMLSEIMQKSSGNNWVLERYNPCPGVMPDAPASRQYRGGFGSSLMLKDLRLALDGATNTHTDTALGALACDLYARHCAAGGAQLDFSSIFQFDPASVAVPQPAETCI